MDLGIDAIELRLWLKGYTLIAVNVITDCLF